MDYSNMSIRQIAALINNDWSNVNFAAQPYLKAMFALDTVKDNYYCDTGESVVAYFLCNARSWKGDVAREIKKELNKRIK